MRSALAIVNSTDTKFIKFLAPALRQFARVEYYTGALNGPEHLRLLMSRYRADCVITTRFKLFNPNLEGTKESNLGSLYTAYGIQFLLLPDFSRVFSENYMTYLCSRWCEKLTAPHKYVVADAFAFEKVTPQNLDAIVRFAENRAFVCATDVETDIVKFKENKKDKTDPTTAIITHCAWTFAYVEAGVVKTKSFALEFFPDWSFALDACRKLNATKVAKIMHRGIYDSVYFLRFDLPAYNYAFDTYNLQHCIFAELPKSLAEVTQQYVLNIRYWKEMSGYAKTEYNARDTHATVWAFLGMIKFMQQESKVFANHYAVTNFLKEFKLNFPFLSCAMEGIRVDLEVRDRLREIEMQKANNALAELRYLLSWPDFNPASSQQVLKLMTGFGFNPPTKLNANKESVDSSDKKALQKFSEAHPLHTIVVDLILTARKAAKSVSTYYDAILYEDRLLWEIDVAGTETGRAAAKKSALWCGTQVQNIPGYAKEMCIADPGFALCEVDGSQAESRATAYMSQDENLIRTVETSPDFHCTNASLFFGIPFDEIFQVECYSEDGTYHEAKVLLPDIRKVAKSVNHGANYNMGWFVLWETMGTKAVLKAARLLRLPAHYSMREICEYLLSCFSRAYPRIKGEWYAEVVYEILSTGKLVGPTGWTRRTFLQPKRSKSDLNAAVAHGPQSLNVMLVNEAVWDVWWNLQMNKYWGKYYMKAQIHDSIFGQIRVGHEYIAQEIGDIMSGKTVVVHGRTLRIPNEPKYGKKTWKEIK